MKVLPGNHLSFKINAHAHHREHSGICVNADHDETCSEGVFTLYSCTPGEVIAPEIRHFSAAFHPAQLHLYDEKALEELLKDERCLALGECGLDPFAPVPMELQQELFCRQMILAQEKNKPLIVHCVRRFPELIALKKKYWKKNSLPFLIHSFRGNRETALELLKHNCFLSLAPAWLKHLTQFPDYIPIDSFLLETDDRQDITITELYSRTAALLNWDLPALEERLCATFREFLNTEYSL